jgi:hypothetical protein
MKINPAPFRSAQLAITALVVVFSLAIMGTSAHTLHVFNTQQTSNPWWLPMWPQHFATHGTKALVASSVVTFVLCGGFLVALFVPSVQLNQKHTLRAALSLATMLPSFLLSLVTVIWAHVLNRGAPNIDTIQTWTCKYRHSSPLRQDLVVPSNMGNSNFVRVCSESKFALYATLVVFLLLGAGLVGAVVVWLADKWAARQTRKEGEQVSELSYVPKAYSG